MRCLTWRRCLERRGRAGGGKYRRIDWATRSRLAGPEAGEEVLEIDAEKFPPEGDDCDALLLRAAYEKGWKKFIVYRLRGQRFQGTSFGPGTAGVRIDLYGSSGDYVASGIDGMEIQIHGNAQDQLAQIMKLGKLVIHGDVGQTFMYGAKGGEIYVLGNAAGRPLINAVGKPRVCDQRDVLGLSGGVVHGGRSAERRGVRDSERDHV